MDVVWLSEKHVLLQPLVWKVASLKGNGGRVQFLNRPAIDKYGGDLESSLTARLTHTSLEHDVISHVSGAIATLVVTSSRTGHCFVPVRSAKDP